jgi:hypothetical protein
MKIKTILFVLIICFISIGCTHERAIWKNVYIKVDPANMDQLLVKYNNGEWMEQENGDEFHVILKTWEDSDTGEKMYSVTYAGPVKVYAAYFSGFNNLILNKNGAEIEDHSLELPFDYKRQYSFKSTGQLKEAEVYELSVSEYLLD